MGQHSPTPQTFADAISRISHLIRRDLAAPPAGLLGRPLRAMSNNTADTQAAGGAGGHPT